MVTKAGGVQMRQFNAETGTVGEEAEAGLGTTSDPVNFNPVPVSLPEEVGGIVQ